VILIQSVIQDAVSILNVVVLAVGYYFLVKLYREWIRQSKEERIAGGRPQVVVAADYSHLPEVNLAVRNFTKAPPRRSPSGSRHLSRTQRARYSRSCPTSRKVCPSSHRRVRSLAAGGPWRPSYGCSKRRSLTKASG
jgi:hypothetical protein